MTKLPLLLTTILFLLLGLLITTKQKPSSNESTPTPTPHQSAEEILKERFPNLVNWQRPAGPPKVALQVGHWKNEEVPEELKNLRGNTGAFGAGKYEWEVNYQIATAAAKLLDEKGYWVELLPATIPEGYWADIFIAIHADGSTNTERTGFKVASSPRDFTGKANKLVSLIEQKYQQSTNLSLDPIVTNNMLSYYAFSWWRFNHALHPKTVATILETGFLTNPKDREIILENADLSAEGLVSAIDAFFKLEISIASANLVSILDPIIQTPC